MANKVGPLIKQARTDAGLSQEKLAAKIDGLSANDISKAERGELELTQVQLKAIAKATGVTQTSLVEAAKASTYKAATAAKKPAASKTDSAKPAGTAVTLTAAEKKLVELYRAANSETKKAAVAVLKGEAQIDKGLLVNILESVGNASGKDDLLGSLLSGLTGK